MLTLSFSLCFSQLTLTRKDKSISLDTNRIWGVQTKKVLLLSVFDHKYYRKKHKYDNYEVHRLDTVKQISRIGDSIKFAVSVVQHYRDTTTGETYSNMQIEKEWKKGNYRSKRVLQDTIFHFAIADIRQMQVQTRRYRQGDAMGIFGMFLMGTGVTIYSAVTIPKGNPNGYYGLALGASMLGLAKHWINQSKWLEDFKLSQNKWTIQGN